jgi:acyl-CoA thioesterase I
MHLSSISQPSNALIRGCAHVPSRAPVPLRALVKVGALLLALNLVTDLRAQTSPCRIAVLGDSLASAYGVAVEEGFPAQLESALEAQGFACTVIDAGVSGDTSAGGRSRLDWVLADEPSHLLVELGGNDALRALPVEQLAANLDAIVAGARQRGVAVFLAGMLAPPNLGRSYTDAFRQAYLDVAERHDVPLYPFFLEGVVTEPDLMQPDGIHPGAPGVQEIVRRILPAIGTWLAETSVQPG